VLVYGHYDVQPVDPIELWKSDPFKPEIRDGAIYARGANDDKGQTFMHVKVLEYLVKENKLKHNIKFILEGEEEIGSPSLAKWAKEHKDLLKCDLILVSDTTMISEKVPSINCGMRGLAYLEVEVTGPNKDLHSGHYGGAVYNPINALCSMIDSLIDENGHITVKGFYDDVVELSKEDRAMLSKAPFDLEEYKKSIDIDEVKGEKGYSTLERTGIRPCLDVCGIWGGYTGEGAKTVLPSKAHAKISMRLVPNQNCDKIAELFTKHFLSIAPKGVKVKVTNHHGGNGFLMPISSSAYKAASKAMGEVYGIDPVPSRGGGSIPILADLQNILGVNPLLMGFGLERDTIHSPNESYLISQFEKGMESIAKFYEYYE
jgi:Acetylornithine deacetylase/Succinyl-diaminopimelate desuccinylase and related deacylases